MKLIAVGFAFCAALSLGAGTTYNISAPGGVGDVVALTNAFAKVGAADSSGSKILLEPGVYDLKGTKIGSGGAHWRLDKKMKDGLIAGTGATPGDTIILGGGDTDKVRIFHFWTTDANHPTTISNLTLTGGYTTGDGGGIYGSTPTYGGNLVLRHVIVSNNYAKGSTGAGGGGVIYAKAYDCLFAGNTCEAQHGGGLYTSASDQGAWGCVFSNNVVLTTSRYGAGYYCASGGQCVGCKFYDNVGTSGIGAYVSGDGLVSNCVFRGNKPTAAASSNKLGGGLFLSTGECVDCRFYDNAADSGGGVYVNYSSAVVRNCLFEGNKQTGWASGAALFVNASRPLALVSNCVFNANVANKESSRTAISNAELVDCVVTNHTIANGNVLSGCNMTRCLFAWNSATGNGCHLDVCSPNRARTNANCVVIQNKAMGINSISDKKVVVNCTYVGNFCDSGNYGTIARDGACWNSIFTGNTVSGIGASASDVRRNFHGGEVHELYLTNCVFSSSDVAVDADYLHNCKKIPMARIRFRESEDGGPYDIKSSSPAFGAGVWEDWMADCVGPLDFARRPRVMFDAIDVGALECQSLPGLLLFFR